jgi:predicted HNH restriction endonuclease
VSLQKDKILGFVTFGGTPNSHTSILARAMGIPALVGVGEIDDRFDSSYALLDAAQGSLTIDPDEARLSEFEKNLESKMQADFVEGEQETIFTTKYERNPQARAACLAYHGYTCKICSMSFEKTYGPEFKDIIEVHHIVPLNQIGEAYVVDPINDLIPVCPNCHTAIHSKSGGKLQPKKQNKQYSLLDK